MITPNRLVDVAGGKLVQLFVVPKNDNCDVHRTQDRKLVCLLEETAFSLEEGAGYHHISVHVRGCGGGVGQHSHRTVSVVLDSLDFNLSTTHGRVCSSRCARVLRSSASKIDGVSERANSPTATKGQDHDQDRLSQVAGWQQIALSETDPDTNRRTVQRGGTDDIPRYNVALENMRQSFELPDENLAAWRSKYITAGRLREGRVKFWGREPGPQSQRAEGG